MTITVSANEEAYRHLLRVTFEDMRAGICRVRHRRAELDSVPPPPDLVDLLRQRAKHLRHVVDALAERPVPIEPTLSPHLQTAHLAALTTIEECIAAGKAAAACDLAQRLVVLIALELSWMPQP